MYTATEYPSPPPILSPLSLCLYVSLSLSHTHKLFSGCWRWEVRAHEWAFFSMYDIYIFPRYPFHLSITNQTATTLTQLQTELSWEKLDTIKKKKSSRQFRLMSESKKNNLCDEAKWFQVQMAYRHCFAPLFWEKNK